MQGLHHPPTSTPPPTPRSIFCSDVDHTDLLSTNMDWDDFFSQQRNDTSRRRHDSCQPPQQLDLLDLMLSPSSITVNPGGTQSWRKRRFADMTDEADESSPDTAPLASDSSENRVRADGLHMNSAHHRSTLPPSLCSPCKRKRTTKMGHHHHYYYYHHHRHINSSGDSSSGGSIYDQMLLTSERSGKPTHKRKLKDDIVGLGHATCPVVPIHSSTGAIVFDGSETEEPCRKSRCRFPSFSSLNPDNRGTIAFDGNWFAMSSLSIEAPSEALDSAGFDMQLCIASFELFLDHKDHDDMISWGLQRFRSEIGFDDIFHVS